MWKLASRSCDQLVQGRDKVAYYVLFLDQSVPTLGRVEGVDARRPCYSFLKKLFPPQTAKEERQFERAYGELKAVVFDSRVWLRRLRSMVRPDLFLLQSKADQTKFALVWPRLTGRILGSRSFGGIRYRGPEQQQNAAGGGGEDEPALLAFFKAEMRRQGWTNRLALVGGWIGFNATLHGLGVAATYRDASQCGEALVANVAKATAMELKEGRAADEAWVVEKTLGKGAYGAAYLVHKANDEKAKFVLKVQTDCGQFTTELDALHALKGTGAVVRLETAYVYPYSRHPLSLVMDRLDETLLTYIDTKAGVNDEGMLYLDDASAIFKRLIEIRQTTRKAGYLLLDWHLGNTMRTAADGKWVRIDLGFARGKFDKDLAHADLGQFMALNYEPLLALHKGTLARSELDDIKMVYRDGAWNVFRHQEAIERLNMRGIVRATTQARNLLGDQGFFYSSPAQAEKAMVAVEAFLVSTFAKAPLI